MNDVLVDIRDAVVSYQHEDALCGVSLQVRRGEFIGVIGPNGAGKTTLLTIINGLGNLVSGQVAVLGMNPYNSARHQVRRRVGYVAQVERIDPRLPITVRETVLCGCCGKLGWLRRPSKEHHAAVEEALEKVGVAHLARRPIGQLSGGEYQRVAIARALVQNPALFLFDEPTASVDPQAQEAILEVIQALHREQHITALYVTHDLATLPQACSRLILMRHGAIWQEGEREAMLEAGVLKALYNGIDKKREAAALFAGVE